MPKQDMICTTCGFVGPAVTKTPGNIWYEIILWIFFILPGVLYSIYRLASKKQVCSSCGNPTLIPIDSPKGQEMMRKNQPQT